MTLGITLAPSPAAHGLNQRDERICGIETVTPDDFLSGVLLAHPATFPEAVGGIRRRLRKPRLSGPGYIAGLRGARLHLLADLLDVHMRGARRR